MNHCAFLGAGMGIGSEGITEAGAVPNGFTSTGVIQADIHIRFWIHLRQK